MAFVSKIECKASLKVIVSNIKAKLRMCLTELASNIECKFSLTLRAPRGGRKRPPLGFSSVVFARGMILKRNFG